MCLLKGSTYSIQYSYIAGSIASECGYVLVGVVEDTRDINGTIDESSTVNQDVSNIKDYGRIIVYNKVKALVKMKLLTWKTLGTVQ